MGVSQACSRRPAPEDGPNPPTPAAQYSCRTAHCNAPPLQVLHSTRWLPAQSTSVQVDVRKIDNTAVLAKQLERLQAS